MSSSAARAVFGVAVLLALPVAAFRFGRPRPLAPADFTFVLPSENATFDPAAAASVPDQWLILELFEGLTRLDPETLEPRPAAAASWSASADGRTTTFTLRDDGRWSDGRPVTAADFEYTFRRLVDPKTGCPNAQLFGVIAGANAAIRGEPAGKFGVHAQGDRTLTIETDVPCPYLPSLVSHFACVPVREDVIARAGDRWTEPGTLVGNGPYRLLLRRVRDRVRLVRNEAWHDAASVAFGVIDARVIESSSTALNLYLTGGVDWVNAMPSSAVPPLRVQRSAELRQDVLFATNFLRMNVARGPLADVRVRRALDQMLDRDALCTFVYRKGDRPARSFVPPKLPGYRPAPAPKEDVAAARALLAEAGFPDGVGFPELELLHASDETARGVAEAIASRAKETLNIRLRPLPQEYQVFLDSQRQRKYDLCLAVWVGDYPDPTTFLDVFRSDSSANRTGWEDAEYDRLLDAARATTAVTERADRLAAAEARLLEAGPIAVLSIRGQPNLVRPDIRGFTTNLLDLHPLELLSRASP